MTSSLEFPPAYPGEWNVPVLLQYRPVIFNVQKNEEESAQEDCEEDVLVDRRGANF